MAGIINGGFRPRIGSEIKTSKGPRTVQPMMKTQIEILPWQTPNFVIGKMPPRPRQEGLNPDAAPKWSLAETDTETLAGLCDNFRAEVFRKAGKADPAPPSARNGTGGTELAEAVSAFLSEYAKERQPHGGIDDDPMDGDTVAFHARRILKPALDATLSSPQSAPGTEELWDVLKAAMITISHHVAHGAETLGPLLSRIYAVLERQKAHAARRATPETK